MSSPELPQTLDAKLQEIVRLMNMRDHARAAARLEEAAAAFPHEQSIDLFRAKIAGARQDPAGVLTALEPTLEREPDVPQLLFARIHALYSLGRLDEALAAIDQTNAPDGSPLRHNLNGLRVKCLQRHGKVDQIEKTLEELIKVEGHSPRIVDFEIDLLRRQGDLEKAIELSCALLDRPDLKPKERVLSGLTLARLQDRLGRHDEAFETAVTANESGNQPFDTDAHIKETDELINFFTAQRLQTLPSSTTNSERPVFIVGMPRSGTSMLEQIIASHPQGGGLGERQDPFILAEDLNIQLDRPLPEALAEVTPEQLDRLAKRYIDMIESSGLTGDRIVIKPLGLDRLVGFLTLLLPNARFIWIHRQPADNLLSLFLHPVFKPWAWRLEDLIVERQMHDRLRNHWLKARPTHHLAVSYEAMTSDQAAETERMLHFLGLPSDPRTLSFHESARVVMTPSAEQVRRPMHQEAVDRWTQYEKHLKPVLKAFPRTQTDDAADPGS